MSSIGTVVYCRFGKDYIKTIAKEAQQLILSPNLS